MDKLDEGEEFLSEMEAKGEPPPAELVAYQRWIQWGKQDRHFPEDTESHVFHHYFNMVHAIFSAWEAAKYETDEDKEKEERETTRSADGQTRTVSPGGGSSTGLSSSPRSDPRLADSRRGRQFPKLTSTS